MGKRAQSLPGFEASIRPYLLIWFITFLASSGRSPVFYWFLRLFIHAFASKHQLYVISPILLYLRFERYPQPNFASRQRPMLCHNWMKVHDLPLGAKECHSYLSKCRNQGFQSTYYYKCRWVSWYGNDEPNLARLRLESLLRYLSFWPWGPRRRDRLYRSWRIYYPSFFCDQFRHLHFDLLGS